MYYKELSNHIELLIFDNIYTSPGFLMIDSYCNMVSLCICRLFLRGHMANFIGYIKTEIINSY